ncbi:MAG: PHP domain-containing protein [Desulfobacteraceae bacterium]|nr:PHP domain-containing protein [Desulfobacteraceae bacterium]
MLVDFHIHSIYSDGTQTPEEIVSIAKKKMISAISITDHDTMDGVQDALFAGKKHGVEVIPGLELSVEYKNMYMHLLAYSMDIKNLELVKGLKQLQKARDNRNLKILDKLNAQGISITAKDIKLLSRIGQTGRPHIAKFLVTKGVVKNMNQAFTLYLRKGASAYASRFVFSAEEAISMIKNAGGLAVLAHPVQIDPTLKSITHLVQNLHGLGLDGLEIYYPNHSRKIVKCLRKIALKFNLIHTGGSDYHGDIRPGTSLANGKKIHVPDEVFAVLKKRWIMNQG